MKDSQIEYQVNEAQEFLETLFHPLDANEQIEIRYRSKDLSKPRMNQKFVDEIDLASSIAVALCTDNDVYMGAAPRTGGIGTRAGVSRINALWADFDVGSNSTDKDIFKRTTGIKYPPSMLVHSGGGYHCYWLLKKPARSEHDLLRAEALMKTIARALGGDSVWDRARILRIPGTLNHKKDVPRPVRFAFGGDSMRFSLDQLEDMATGLSLAYNVGSQHSSGTVRKDALDGQIEEGGRNLILTSVAGSLRSRGLDGESIFEVLQVLNGKRCSPPLPYNEVVRIAESISKYDVGTPRYKKSFAKRIFGKGGS